MTNETGNARINESDFVRLTAPAKLEIERILPASPERVWEYLVDPELRKQWFCAGETGTQPGEPFVMDFDHSRLSTEKPPADMDCGDPITMQGTILTFEPPKVLSYNWPEEDGSGTIVTIRLEAEGENTRLHLSHERLENPEFKKGASAGWHAHLDLLLDLIREGHARDFWLHFATVKEEYNSRISE